MTYIIDAHQDIAFNAITYNRNILVSAMETRKSEEGSSIPEWNNGEATVGWPDYQAGEIAVIFGSLFILPWNRRSGEWDRLAYQTTRQASALYHDQIDFYNRLTDENLDKFKLIKNQTDLAAVLEPWENPIPRKNRPVGIVISMEGAEGLQHVDELIEFYELGLRQVGPVWAGNRYCGGSYEDRPFDNEGRELLKVMSELGIALDISHMREEAALTAMDLFDGYIVASHANSRKLLKGTGVERHLTDRVIHKLLERGGRIGVLPYNKFLSAEWTPSSPRDFVTINDIVSQIDYYCQLAGNSTQVGLGSDFDGGFGFPQIPLEINTIKDLQLLKPALLEKSYTIEDVENIFALNWKKHLELVLPK